MRLGLAVAAILLIAIAPVVVQASTSSTKYPESISIIYKVSLYASQSEFFSGSSSGSVDFKVCFERVDDYYTPINITIISMRHLPPTVAASQLLNLVEYPTLKHFSLKPEDLAYIKKHRTDVIDGVDYEYDGYGVLYMGDNKFEDGYRVTIEFGVGSKEALYDQETGLLLSELFSIRLTGFLIVSHYIVYVKAIVAPSFIGNKGINYSVLKILQLIAAIVGVGAVAAFALRSRYRIL